MRLNLCILAVGSFLVFTPATLVPAVAGNVVVTNGQLAWQSTQCTAPEPSSFSSNSNHTAAAEVVNRRMKGYNDYVAKAEAYMDCLSQEAQADAKIASDAITASAQSKIDETKKTVTDTGAPFVSKH